MYPKELYARLTERSRTVLALAEAQARQLGHPTVEPEHVLLGLAKEGHGVAANVLRNLDAGFDALRSEAEKRAEPLHMESANDPVPSDATAHLLSVALADADVLNHRYIGTEHLLLAITRLREGVVPEILAARSLTPTMIRREVYDLLGHRELADAEREPGT